MSEPGSGKFQLNTREIALIVLFWTSLAAVSSLNRLMGARDLGFGRVIAPTGPIFLAFIEAWIWAAFTPLIFWLSSTSSEMRSRALRILLLTAAGVGIAVAAFLLLDVARGFFAPMPMRRRGGGGGGILFAPLRQIARFRFLNHLLVYGAVLAAGFAREYFLRDRRRQQHEMRLQAQLAEARLDALRMQINPHFLFNTLHAVSALVERDPAGVRRMIARLSELLRHTIDSRATDEVPLRDEIAFLRRYIEIMEIRFQGRLEVAIAVDDDVLGALVPNLILQPIVENALEHGVNRAGGEGRIEIAVRREDDDLVMTVRDNGPGIDTAPASGVGLSNTRARLEQLYGEDARLTLSSVADGGTLARITVPYHTAADGRFEGRDA